METESLAETSTEDSSIDITDTISDLSDLSGAHYQGLALLQKLQQLKVWQAAQEDLLLDEQRKQMENLTGLDNDPESREQETNLEEKPVPGSGKSFQQLLAEKLEEEGQKESVMVDKTPVRARQFLKKGSGLARFNLNQENSTPIEKKRTPSPRKTPGDLRKVSSALVSSSTKKSSKHVSIQSPPRTLKLKQRYDLSDSVENSFCDKLSLVASRQEKDKAELEVFRMLESAANEASFCSNSSRIQNLVSAAVLPSPCREKSVQPSFISSTPAPPAPDPALDRTEDNTLGQSIMVDIKKFLLERLSDGRTGPEEVEEENEDSDWTDESDDTIQENEETSEVSIGKDWRENIPPPSQPAAKPREVLTFSPPEKLPANPPSRLIWDIFGRENQRKKQKPRTKSASGQVKTTSDTQRRKSAPLTVRFDPNTNKPGLGNGVGNGGELQYEPENEENVSYQSTLLRMRVAELEQEIETFKLENKKIMNLKKKLQTDKENLAKDLASFEDLKTTERKKIEEEKRRIKRDQSLLEKRNRAVGQEKCKNCDELKTEINKLEQNLKSKDSKFTEEVSKLKNNLKLVKSDNQELQNEVQRMKNKQVHSKIAGSGTTEPEIVVTNHSRDTSTQRKVSAKPEDGNVEIKEKTFEDGHQEVWYSNGNRKEISRDGETVKIFYYNGDVKESWRDGTEKYLYSESQTWHTKTADGTQIIQFSNGQQETRSVTGETTIAFPDGTSKTISVTGEERISFPDGTVVTVDSAGNRRLEMANGQTEEHTSQYKKRTYPDGTVKTLHADGRQETRYANGRVRTRDAAGNLVQDSG